MINFTDSTSLYSYSSFPAMLSPEDFEMQTKVSLIHIYDSIPLLYTWNTIPSFLPSFLAIFFNIHIWICIGLSCRWVGCKHHPVFGRLPSPPSPGRTTCLATTRRRCTGRARCSTVRSITVVLALQHHLPAPGNASIYLTCVVHLRGLN